MKNYIFCIGLFLLGTTLVFAQQQEIVWDDTVLLDKPMRIASHTRIIGKKGNLLKIARDGKPYKLTKGALILDGVEDVTIERVNFDLNASDNFATLVYLLNCKNVTIQNCTFINSNQQNAPEEWTLHGINARDVDQLTVVGNYSNGCQFKLDGASYSATNLKVSDNFIENCTQMGISVVATARSRSVEIKNVEITNNVLRNIDDIGIYLGVDSGAGTYDSTFIMENITIAGNRISELGYLLNSTPTRGIQIRGTKDTKCIRIFDNTIVDSVKTKFSRGMDIKNADDNTLMQSIIVQQNRIHNMDHFGIIIRASQHTDVVDNYCEGGKGILIDGCQSGAIVNNVTKNTRYHILNESTDMNEVNNTVKE